jgi:chromosome partitioning protein
VLLGEAEIRSALVSVEPGGFVLLPANQDLTAAEVRLLTMMAGRETKLRNAIASLRESFDVILIDCPPALNMLTVNSLVAADSVLIPMQCEYYALEGLSALLATVEQIREAVNPNLELEGILRTMFDPRNNLANEVSAQLIMHFGDKVFRTIIPRNIRLAEAPSFGKPVLFHDRESRGALAYLALAGEMIRREEEEREQAIVAAAAGGAAGAGAGDARAPEAGASDAGSHYAETGNAGVPDAETRNAGTGNTGSSDGVSQQTVSREVAANEPGTESIASESTEDAPFVSDPHTVQTDS